MPARSGSTNSSRSPRRNTSLDNNNNNNINNNNPPPSNLLVPVTANVIDPTTALGIPLKFVTVSQSIEITGYQLYAVEKWIVDRTRPIITTLVVYTGHESHKISLAVLRPSPLLSSSESHAEWDKAIQHLRRDGARPKQTPRGILMATSLAHFRSDYTIVYIPDGNFLAIRDQLYANINLLRMGCSGRAALTLDEPSDTTKDRFITTYHLPEYVQPSNAGPGPPTKSRSSVSSPSKSGLLSTKDSASFIATVLELVKLVQAGLALFGMYNGPMLDGLLCDDTVEGIRKWIVEIGQPCVGLEPMGRIADPTFLAAILSLALSLRNKLCALGFSQHTPKDPFLQPTQFLAAVYQFSESRSTDSTSPHYHQSLAFGAGPFGTYMFPPPQHLHSPSILPIPPSLSILSTSSTPSHSHSQPHSHLSVTSQSPTPASLSPAPSTLSPRTSSSTHPQIQVLTKHLVDTISSAYEAKQQRSPSVAGPSSTGIPSSSASGRRISRAIKGKLRGGSNAHAGMFIDKDRGESDLDGDRATSGGEGVASGGEHDRDRERDGARGHSSGGQALLNGLGSFASGLASGVGGTLQAVGGGVGAGVGAVVVGAGASNGDSGGGAGNVLGPNNDLLDFVRFILCGGNGKAGRKGRKGGRRDSVSSLAGSVGGGAGGDVFLDIGYGHAGAREVQIGGSVRMLWSGAVWTLVRVREALEARMAAAVARAAQAIGGGTRTPAKWPRDKDRWALSDGDVDEIGNRVRSETEDDSEGHTALPAGFGGIWGEKMQRKLESWTGLSKRRGRASLDLSTPSSSRTGTLQSRFDGEKGDSLSTKPSLAISTTDAAARTYSDSPETKSGSAFKSAREFDRTLSPTLPPITFGGIGEPDDDLLSSGQVSPVDAMRANPFSLLHNGRALDNPSLMAATSTNDSSVALNNSSSVASGPGEYERKINDLLAGHGQKKKRGPVFDRVQHPSRVSSWADPYSARDGIDDGFDSDEEEEEEEESSRSSKMDKKRASTWGHSSRGKTLRFDEEPQEIGKTGVRIKISDADADEALGKHSEGEYDYEPPGRRLAMARMRRRRSYHDLDSLREMPVFPLECMRIDVELCGQLLIMVRREQHLQNVIACLHVLTANLTNTNSALREEHQSHLPFLSELEARTQAISAIDVETAKADKTSQAAHTLRYEAEQFRIPDLWHTATPPRKKVLELRDKVFGTGGRRLPSGVHGAHGKFNRLQWRLDGTEWLVDRFGRTEEEAEEEVVGIPFEPRLPVEDEGEVVSHQGIKPVWLLRFFTNWGAMWGARTRSPGNGNPRDKQAAESNGNETKADPISRSHTMEDTTTNML